jgi:crossover junction endodeoxyribonuclease RusA
VGGSSYTIELPPGLPRLSLNDRIHWRVRAKRGADLKNAALFAAVEGNIPHLRRVQIDVEYQPPDNRRRDADNPLATVKYLIDGLVKAGVVPDDQCPRYVEWIRCRIGEKYPQGRFVLTLTEVSDDGDRED